MEDEVKANLDAKINLVKLLMEENRMMMAELKE